MFSKKTTKKLTDSFVFFLCTYVESCFDSLGNNVLIYFGGQTGDHENIMVLLVKKNFWIAIQKQSKVHQNC